MKIALSQINPKTADFGGNYKRIEQSLSSTPEEYLSVFPSLCLSGSPLYSLSEYEDTFRLCAEEGEELEKTKRDILFGIPVQTDDRRYNALVFLERGEMKAVATKRNLGQFDHGFSVGNGFETVDYKGKRLAFGFLEDLEDFCAASPKADLVLCAANTVFEEGIHERVKQKVRTLARKLACTIVVVNRCGAEGRYVFSGGSFVMQQNGNPALELPYFSPETALVDTEKLQDMHQSAKQPIEILHDAAVLGIRDYFHKNGIGKAVIGLSGGIDSALVVVLAVEALGRENVIGVLLPSEYSTSHSITDAENSANNLGIKHYTIPIKQSYTSILSALDPVFAGIPFSLAEENIQPRIRGTILMGIANKIGAALLNTSNKSEAAVGYGTIYGDMSGGIGVIGDLYKTRVWEMSRWINREREVIPENSITKAPSAELRPDQKDSDSLPDYSVLDRILFEHLENRKSRDEIVALGFEAQTVEKVLRLVRINEWKRHQAAPSLKLSSCTFGIDRQTPIS